MKNQPTLDPSFVPAVLWNRDFQNRVQQSGGGEPFVIVLERPGGSISRFDTRIFSDPEVGQLGECVRYVERLLKFLLWQRGGAIISLGGNRVVADQVAAHYQPAAQRSFDCKFIGDQVYRQPLTFRFGSVDEMPAARETTIQLGRHLDGCRIGFDLGGSDRKSAAVIDGEVVFSEEIEWDPYFENDPEYHYRGINDSLKRAAEKLPRVDAIGGSAAGVYVDNEVRVASLFRGVSEEDFEKRVRRMFFDLKKEWNDVPFEVVNDGEVTALAGAMSTGANGVLGVAMGTSEAVGYVNPDGHITPWLNELAFAPVDYRDQAPVDEWSGDHGCGAQYFCQQAVARLAPVAGLEYPDEMGFPERLIEVQKLMKEGDSRAADIYDTIGTCFGYSIAHYADFYEIENVLVLGRVTSGEGGERIISNAEAVLADEFPDLNEKISLRTPGEKEKRHGQSIAAASLPALEN
ncbi:MAG: ROK family protein [Verrucomicrobia bacterium]|nr:ROK family protein [Verrucomicrobiota bacterium]